MAESFVVRAFDALDHLEPDEMREFERRNEAEAFMVERSKRIPGSRAFLTMRVDGGDIFIKWVISNGTSSDEKVN